MEPIESKGNDKKENKKFYYVLGLAGQVTFLLAGPVVVCLFVGLWADSYFRTTPLFIIIGVILGFSGSVFNVFKVMKIVE